jgi:hypothetical protein
MRVLLITPQKAQNFFNAAQKIISPQLKWIERGSPKAQFWADSTQSNHLNRQNTTSDQKKIFETRNS